MGATAPEAWIATSNGRDMIRADAMVVVRLDGDRLTAQLHDEAKVTVTLVEGAAGENMPADLHRRLLRAVAELADAGGATQLIVPIHDDQGWHWTTEPL